MLLSKEQQTNLYLSGAEYDTLLISEDYELFMQLISFLREFAPERKPILLDNLSSLSAFESSLSSCDIMICDIRTHFSNPDLTSVALECVHQRTLSVGVINSYDNHKDILTHPLNLKLAGIIDNKNGWVTTWRKISALKKAWDNPVMVSRIEEGQLSDILQMIASARWSSIVYIEGYRESIPSRKDKPLRGSISFVKGEPHTAWSWKNIGVEAIFDLLSITEGTLKVMKNLSPSPVKNVYLQMEEILLSHAVSLDEQLAVSQSTPHNISLPILEEHISLQEGSKSSHKETNKNLEEKPLLTQDVRKKLSWWEDNVNIIIDIIKKATPHSFFLRWMGEEEIKRIVNMVITQRGECDNFVICYGNELMLSRFFSACTKGFTSDKLQGKLWIPVMRCGLSLEKCLYFGGLFLGDVYQYLTTLPSLVFISSSKDLEIAKSKVFKKHTIVFVLSPSGIINKENFSKDMETKNFYIIDDFEFTWQKLTESLVFIVNSLKKIEEERI